MSDPDRPDPDLLLARLTAEQPGFRGRLKVFLGMCPGVGKTCAMLEEAAQWQEPVVAGVVETHGRRGTLALLEGFEVLPRRTVSHQGVSLSEFDLDAAMAHPAPLVLVDELAHHNAPGSRHPKRWMDVMELLQAGKHVFTTINIQHLESQMDLVRRITGIPVPETVPDSVLDEASEIELVDLTPAALRERLAEGKIYPEGQAIRAGENFFRQENIAALREMALRYTAEHAGKNVRTQWKNPARPLPKTQEKLLVGVGPGPYAASLIRWTRRAAARLQCPWMAVSIETGNWQEETVQQHITQQLLVAKRLGAETLTLGAPTVWEGISRAAQEHGASQIILGKPGRRRGWKIWQDAWRVHQFISAGGPVDIHLVSQDGAPAIRQDAARVHSPDRPFEGLLGGITAVVTVLGVTLLSLPLTDSLGYRTVALFYLLTVVLLALQLSRGPMLLAAALAALAWNFFFIPPRFTLAVKELHDAILLGTFFVVALVAGQITARLRRQERLVRERERRTAILQRLTETLALGHDPDTSLQQALREVEQALDAQVCLFRRKNPAEMEPQPAGGGQLRMEEKDRAVASWVYVQGQPAGRFTDTLPEASATWYPLRTAAMISGVLGVNFLSGRPPGLSQRGLLAAITAQLALALEKVHFMAAIRQADLTEESNRLHKILLDSVSHELKTPLAVLRGAAEQLHQVLPPEHQSTVEEVAQASLRLHRVVDQLLDLSRLESGLLTPLPEWGELGELCTQATHAAGLEEAQIRWDIPEPSLLIITDQGMLATALTNLLQNAAAHQAPGLPVEASARWSDDTLVFSVRDRGPGLPEGGEEAVFEKFYRGPKARAGGLGLGLSIVKGLVQALGGSVTAARSDGGGAQFTLVLKVQVAYGAPGQTP